MLRHLMTVGSGKVLSSILGLALNVVIAQVFGIGRATDAYFMSRGIAESLGKFLFLTQASEVFMPAFFSVYEKDRRRAWGFANAVLILSLGGAVVSLVFLMIPAARFVVQIFAPGFDEATLTATSRLFPFWMTFVFLAIGTSLLNSVLQGMNRFVLPAGLALLNAPFAVLTFLVWGTQLGISAFALGYVLAQLVSLTCLVIATAYLGNRGFLSWQPVRDYLRRLSGFGVSNTVSLGGGVAYRAVLSLLPGGTVSALALAQRLHNLFADLTITTFGTVTFPRLTRVAVSAGTAVWRVALRQYVLLGVGVALMLSVPAAIWRELISGLAYGRIKLSVNELQLIAGAFGIYMLSLPPNAGYATLRRGFLARGETTFVVRVGVFAEALGMVLYYPMAMALGYAGLILTGILMTTVMAGVYLFTAEKR